MLVCGNRSVLKKTKNPDTVLPTGALATPCTKQNFS